MNLNEPSAALREQKIGIVDVNGAALTNAAFAFQAGTVKLLKPDGSCANVAANPIYLANSLVTGIWSWTPSQAEVSVLVGQYELQLLGGGLLATGQRFAFEVRDPVNAFAAIMDAANAGNANYPPNAKTFQQQWNILFARLLAPIDGNDGPVGSIGVPTLGEPSASPAPHRAEFTVQGGKVRWTKLDGT